MTPEQMVLIDELLTGMQFILCIIGGALIVIAIGIWRLK